VVYIGNLFQILIAKKYNIYLDLVNLLISKIQHACQKLKHTTSLDTVSSKCLDIS